MSEYNLFERVRYDREAAAVERCHTKPHLLRYPVGLHTHDVLSLIIHCWRWDHDGALPRAELMLAAHAHDKGELVSGDVPSPTKDLLGEQLERLDQRVEANLYGDFELTAEEAHYIEVADRFELWLWAIEEMERGNNTVRPWALRYEGRFETLDLPPSFEKLMVQYNAHTGRLAMSGREILAFGELE